MSDLGIKRIFRKGQTAIRMLLGGNIRDLVILLDKKLRLNYLDFGKESLDELELEDSIANPHQTSGYELENVLDRLEITQDDSIVDLGSGKGGAVLSMAKYPFQKIVGVEISPKLAEIAKRNVWRLGRRKRISIICSNALDYTDLDDFNYIFLFNPFPEMVMKQVIENVHSSLRQKRRNLTIIYSNPTADEIILGGGMFEKHFEYNIPNKSPTIVYVHKVSSGAVDNTVSTA